MTSSAQNETTGKPTPAPSLQALFWEFFKIALFVVGGGYAIIAVADNIFGRKLKWLEEGELLDHLPVFQMIPGIIAGNSAIYTGLKLRGYAGAAVAQAAVALPSIIIFTLVSCGYDALPVDHPVVAGAFLGLRSSLVGIIGATIALGWRRNVRGIYGYVAVALGITALTCLGADTPTVLVSALAAGIVLEYCGLGDSHAVDSAGVSAKPPRAATRIAVAAVAVLAIAAATIAYGRLFWIFVKFGLMSFGGGFVLIPAYIDEFVGPNAHALHIAPDEFGNLMALTQMTPGPVSVNSATFFGYRIGGIPAAIVATTGLFFPSYILLTAALTGLERWKTNRLVQGMLRGVRPATVALMVSACISFAGMSLWTQAADGTSVSLPGCVLAVAAAALLISRKASVMSIIFGSAAAGALWSLLK